jgi:serine/threonine protein phosphatase PrpC
LLCSDGLTNMLADAEIARILQCQTDPEQACKQLVSRANEEGGTDNITVILARYELIARAAGQLRPDQTARALKACP